MADFIPRSDSVLANWARVYSSALASDPESFGISIELSDAFAESVSAFREAYLMAIDPATRTKAAVATKNSDRTAMKTIARKIARMIQANPDVTNDQKLSLGLSVKEDYPQSGGIPTRPPTFSISQELKGTRVKIFISDLDHPGKAKPRGIVGAAIFYHVGPRAPEARSQWNFLRNTTITDATIDLPTGYPPGSMIWLACCWLDTQLNLGPSSNTVYTYFIQTTALPGNKISRRGA